MKKILLTGINARFAHSNPSLYYLRTFIDDLNFDIEILELTINQDKNKTIDVIVEKHSHIIAFSVYIWNVEYIKEVLPEIFIRSGKARIVLGGPEVTYNPEEWLKEYRFIDHIITGHGEAGFREFLLKDNTERIIDKANPHFSTIPFPYKKNDFPGFKNRNIYYESSRGCPFRCSYCVSSHYRQKLEYRPVEMVREELDIIVSHKPKIVKFVDRTFNSKKSHYRGIWEHIVSSYSGKSTLFHFEIYPRLLNEDDFIFLSKVPPGLFQFEAGIQSIWSQTLRNINRNESWEEVKPILERLTGLKNIHLHVDLIIGLPFEKSLQLRESFNQVYSLKADYFQMGVLKVLKGTEIIEKVKEYEIEYSSEAPYTIKSTKWLTPNKVRKFVNISHLIDTLYNRHRFDFTLENLIKLTESPYYLYEMLSDYITSTNGREQSKNWEENAEKILGFVETKYPEMEDFFRDCLMYDWCETTKLNYYPAIFRNENTKRIKKKGSRFFINSFPHSEIEYQGVKFTKEEMKRSIFFSPESFEFRKNFMRNSNALLFLKESGKKIYFTIQC